jgi:hypothetical protein
VIWPIRKKPARGLGYKRDTVLATDRRYAVPRQEAGLEPVDLREYVPELLSQGPMSACVGFSYVAVIHVVETMAGLPYIPRSPRFVYFNSRAMHGWEKRDEGTFLRFAADGARKVGAATEETCPSDPKLVNAHPGAAAYMEAHNTRDCVFERITSTGEPRLQDIRAALCSGQPVVIGTDIAQSLMDASPRRRVVQRPGSRETIIGGHAMAVVGWDAEGFIIQNSWGPEYGENGFVWLTDEYLEWSGTSEIVVLRDWNRIRERLGGQVA